MDLKASFVWPVIILVLAIVMAWPFIGQILGWENSNSDNLIQEGWQVGKCTRVLDGDTIVVDIEGVMYTVKYLGAEAPFAGDALRAAELKAKEATALNKEMVEGRSIYLEKDINEMDTQGRYLRYVRTNMGSLMLPRLVMVNEEMIKKGLAKAVVMGNNIKYQSILSAAEAQAKSKKVGIWAIIK